MHIRQQEIDTQFFTPRTYQVCLGKISKIFEKNLFFFQLELVDKAKQRNIIVPLGTGTGKTFIAVMLIKELAAPLRIPLEKGGKRSFFLVDKGYFD